RPSNQLRNPPFPPPPHLSPIYFFFNPTATTETYTLSLHDALPILHALIVERAAAGVGVVYISHRLLEVLSVADRVTVLRTSWRRSEEHTSELQSRGHLVCRLLLAKKNSTIHDTFYRRPLRLRRGPA